MFDPKTQIVTFDLDSTVADTDHRVSIIDRVNGTDWHAYSAACVDDTPVEGLVALARILDALGVECHALSGRKSTALEATRGWFVKHDIPIEHIWLDETDAGDYTHASAHMDYKLARLREVERLTGKRVALHVDDWVGVSHVFNEAGIPTICVRTPFEMKEILERDHNNLR